MSPRRGIEVPCRECEGTGMEHSGAYTYDGDKLYDGGTTCGQCLGTGTARQFASMDDAIADLQEGC